MTEAILSLREKHTLEHLRRAEEFGTTLPYYATAYELDLQQLLAGQAQLERKGFWPIPAPVPKAVAERRTQLLAVKVVSETSAAEAAQTTSNGVEREALRCRLTAPNGWVLECDRWPAAPWLTALMGGAA